MTIRHYYAIEYVSASDTGIDHDLVHRFDNVEARYRWAKQAATRVGVGSRRTLPGNSWYVIKAKKFAKLGLTWPISIYTTHGQRDATSFAPIVLATETVEEDV